MLLNHEILICRSTLKVNNNLLNTSNRLRIIATASSGVDHISQDCLLKNNIVLFDAHGSNAPAVADYVLSCLAYLKYENLLPQGQVGIIGYGAVGNAVHDYFRLLNYKVIVYDPLKALHNNKFKSALVNELFNCQILCIHANLHDDLPYPSKNLINYDFLQQLSAGTVIINAARGGIVNEIDLIHYCARNQLIYCTDVYQNEPDINPDVIKLSTICTPHIAGHSIEAKKLAVTMIVNKIYNYYNLSYKVKNDKLPLNGNLQNLLLMWHNNKILNLYNPQFETKQLQVAIDNLMRTFINLRVQHNYRHNYCCVL